MTVSNQTFRRLATSLPETEEQTNNHFSIGNKEFATLFPEHKCAILRLPPEVQLKLVGALPNIFEPCDGAWGKAGATTAQLANANEAEVWEALIASWKNCAPDQ